MPNKIRSVRQKAREAKIVRINRRLEKHAKETGSAHLRLRKIRAGFLREGDDMIRIVNVTTGQEIETIHINDLDEWDYNTEAYVRKWRPRSW